MAIRVGTTRCNAHIHRGCNSRDGTFLSETKVRGVLDPVMTFVNEAVSGIREVKAFAMEKRVTENVRNKMKESMEKEMRKQALIRD